MFRVMIYEDENLQFSDDFEGDVVIGRADESDPAPFNRVKRDSYTKVVLVAFEENSWGRKLLTLKPVAGGTKVRVTNSGTVRPFTVEGEEVAPGKERELPLPTAIQLDQSKFVRVLAGGGQPMALPNATIPPLAGGRKPARLPSLAALGVGVNQKEVIAWLNAATDVLQAAVNSDEFFDRAVTAAVQMVGLDSAQMLLFRSNQWQPVAVKHVRDDIAQVGRPSGSVLTRMLRDKRTLWETVDANQSSQTSLVGVGAVIAAPVLDRAGQVIGALYGERRGRASATMAPPVSEAEAMLVELLARGVAAGLARQEHERAAVFLQNEMQIGRDIQKDFLPKQLLALPNWEIGSKFEAAREVSGDFYDVFQLSETSDQYVGLVTADVCNKGVGAALFMALFRSLLRAFTQQGVARDLTGALATPPRPPCVHGGRHLGDLLVQMNALAAITLTNEYVASVHADLCMFATVFLGVLDTTNGRLYYVNAGHESPLVLGPDGTIKDRLVQTGPAVGMFAGSSFLVRTANLAPGDMLFCYTDGVTDAHAAGQPLFGEQRLLDIVQRPNLTTAELLTLVKSSVAEYTGGGPPFDDLTMLAVRRAPTAPAGC